VDQHKQIKMSRPSMQSPKTQHKKHSIHLNQTRNSLENSLEHFAFIHEIKV
jgi:hypothetical protein